METEKQSIFAVSYCCDHNFIEQCKVSGRVANIPGLNGTPSGGDSPR